MSDLTSNIEHLQEKLHMLIKEYKQVQEENVRLKQEIEILEAEQKEKRIQLFQLEQKLAASQIAVHQIEKAEEEKTALQQKIDAYIKEIDKCLALLHAQ